MSEYYTNPIRILDTTQTTNETGGAFSVEGDASVKDDLFIGSDLKVLQESYLIGNVGINTSTPSYNLDVIGIGRITTSITTGLLNAANSTITQLVVTNATSTTINATGITSGSVYITSGPLVSTFGYNTLGNLFTNPTGNVAIGTVASTNVGKLIIGGTPISSSVQAIVNNASYTSANLRLGVPNANNTIVVGGIAGAGIITNDYGPLQFGSGVSAGASTSYMIINSAGNVGINNTIPNYNLDITGTLQTTQDVTIGNHLLVSNTDQSTSETSGAVIIKGGLGVVKDLYASNIYNNDFLLHGRDCYYVSSTSASSTTSTTPSVKVSITTGNVSTGDYIIHASWNSSSTGVNRLWQASVKLNNNTLFEAKTSIPSDTTNSLLLESGYAIVHMTSGIHTLSIEYNRFPSSFSSTYTIRNAHLRIHRIT